MIPMSLIFVVSTLSCISVMSIMVEFTGSHKQAMTKVIIIGLLLSLIQVWHTPHFNLEWQRERFLIMVLIPIYLLFLSVSRFKGFRFAYTFIFAVSIMTLINTITMTLYALTTNLIFTTSVSLLVLFSICMFFFMRVRVLYQEVQALRSSDWSAFCITPLMSLCLLALLAEEPLSMIFTLAYLEHELLTYAILFINHVLIFINLSKYLAMTSLKKEAVLRETILEGLRFDLCAQLELIKATKLLRHDLRHHLQVLSMAKKSSSHEFETVVEKLLHKLDETSMVTYCKHFSINAIMSAYLKQAQAEKIPVAHRIHLPENLPIEDIDLSLILANAIENAIHANRKIAEDLRYLQLTIDHQPTCLTLLVENPIQDHIEFVNGLPKSHHADHGLGTLSISRLVKQAQGTAYFSAEKGRFSLIVQLPL